MKRLLHFFSLAVMTQVILMLGQLIILPIQLRVWGATATAAWYSAWALATITSFVDCGLRTAGHAELMGSKAAQTVLFQQIWGWIRVLVSGVTLILIAGDLTFAVLTHTPGYGGWRVLLIAACALETMLIIRITYLDSLGKYRGAEASYFLFAALRLVLFLPALLIFHWHEAGLAAIYLAASASALAAQGRFVCRQTPLLQLTAPLPKLSWRTLSLARLTVAEPLSNWVRLNLPILVIGQMASPISVTTFVALRAVFGAGRTTIQQLARVASVEYLKAYSRHDLNRARPLMRLFVVAAVLVGTGLGAFVVIDNMRLLGLWLKHADLALFQQMALAFGVTAPFFSYQIPMNLMFRSGQLAQVAQRHYVFSACSLVGAAMLVLIKSMGGYLALLALLEIGLSVSFFLAATALARPLLKIAAAGCAIICVLWLLVLHQPEWSASGAALLSGMAALIAGLLYRIYKPDFLLLSRRSAVAE